MNRTVCPELLDALPPDNPEAMRSRNDLHKLNVWMGHARIAASVLRPVLAQSHRPRLLEIGAGDGKFFLQVTGLLQPPSDGGTVTLVDQHRLLSPATSWALKARGWQAEVIARDVLQWLPQAEQHGFDAAIANLFLHHFHGGQLRRLFGEVSRLSPLFLAIEPRRSLVSLVPSLMVGLVGCNRVTRHDAPASVRAGFCGTELSALWPDSDAWRLDERKAGLFSHLFLVHGEATCSRLNAQLAHP